MRRWCWVVLCWAAGLTASLPPASGAEPGATCVPRNGTQIVLVPRIDYKMAQVPVLALQPRVVPTTVTIVRDVPEVQTVTRQVVVLVPEERTRTETYTECRMVEEEVSREVTVMQPHLEEREAVRVTSRPILAQESRTISRDAGGWEMQRRTDAHGCVRVCRVWVPRIVLEEIAIDVLKLETALTPVREAVVTWQPETKTITERICRPVVETKTREVTETVCVEKLVERECQTVVWRREAEEQVVNMLVPVAVTEERALLTAERTLVPHGETCPPCER